MDVIAGDTYLRQALVAPEQAARTGAKHVGAMDGWLCLGCAALDGLQITLMGALTLDVALAIADERPPVLNSVILALIAAALSASARRLAKRGNITRAGTGTEAERAATSVLISIALIAAMIVLLTPATSPALPLLLCWGVVSGAASAGLCVGAAHLTKRAGYSAAVAVVGDPDATGDVARAVAASCWPGWRLSRQMHDGAPGHIEQLRALAATGAFDVLVLAVPATDSTRILAICEALSDAPVRICLALDKAVRHPAVPRGVPTLIDLAPHPHAGAGGALKRLLDLTLSGLALVILSPLLGAIAITISLESAGPVLFRQWRFGAGSRPIKVLKFRTMQHDSEDTTGELRTAARDPRVTRAGRILRRTSLDELPQLVNVFRGEMSLVGPRPHPLFMKVGTAFYFDAVADYRARHRVRPGITGWAQINGSRGEIGTLAKAQQRVDLDLWYIENWSLALDLRIIARTVFGGFATFSAD